ncbi:MAG TPA: hypothetical protein VMT00_01120 [Thermoanaerobaculia bacterium]|nr:hypothetical protein [Thermoanaerobaculia bacterium]
MPKHKKQKPPVNPNTPACPVCGRRSTVRRIGERMHYCDHCHEAFTT